MVNKSLDQLATRESFGFVVKRPVCLPFCVKSSTGQLLDERLSKFDSSGRFGGLDYHASISGFYFPVPPITFLAATPNNVSGLKT